MSRVLALLCLFLAIAAIGAGLRTEGAVSNRSSTNVSSTNTSSTNVSSTNQTSTNLPAEPTTATTVTATTTATVASPQPLRYAVIGDSYSNGQSVGMNQAWPVQLTSVLNQNGVPTQLVSNAATTGWTSGDALNDELPIWEHADPQVATILIGANDWIQGISQTAFAERFAALLNNMLAVLHNPQRLIVLTIPNFGVTPTGRSYSFGRNITRGIALFNNVIRQQASQRHLTVINLTRLSENMNNPKYVASDQLHPSALELRLWTAAIAPVVERQWRPFVAAH